MPIPPPKIRPFPLLIALLLAAASHAAPRRDPARVIGIYNQFVERYNDSNKLLTAYEQSLRERAPERSVDLRRARILREALRNHRAETELLEKLFREEFGYSADETARGEVLR